MVQNVVYPFPDTKQEVLFQKLTHSLRCSVCQNQSIADSEAGLAVDLRNEIYQQVRSHRSEAEVVSFMTQRYGDYILYQPPFNMATLTLWLGPLFLILFGMLAFIKYVKFREN